MENTDFKWCELVVRKNVLIQNIYDNLSFYQKKGFKDRVFSGFFKNKSVKI